jgi:hypothetical protein
MLLDADAVLLLTNIVSKLYACLTCLNNCAVCAACSVACHGEHDLVELFNRRNFQCECGTRRMGAGSFCSLSPRTDAPVCKGNHVGPCADLRRKS